MEGILSLETCSICFLKNRKASRICESSLCRGHATLLCIAPVLVHVLPKRANGRPFEVALPPGLEASIIRHVEELCVLGTVIRLSHRVTVTDQHKCGVKPGLQLSAS